MEIKTSREADFSFDKPAAWKVIKPAYYKEFAILSTEAVPCLYGFATEGKAGGYEIVTVFDYGISTPTFISELNEELSRLEVDSNAETNKINNYIKENTDGYAVIDTNAMVPLLHETVILFGKTTFIVITQIETDIGTSYGLQIYVQVKANMLCFSTSMLTVDTARPFESAMENYPHVNNLVNVVIQSLDW